MEFLKVLLIIIEATTSLLIVGLVLIQRSKSEGMGLAFGSGAGESLFGARAGNVLSRATAVLAVVFLLTTLSLGILYSHKKTTLMDSIKSEPPVPVSSSAATPQDLKLPTTPTTSTNQP